MLRILTSGMSLGHYVPAVLIQRSISSSQERVDVLSYEAYLSERTLEQLDRTKRRYQQDFRLAKIGQRVSKLIHPSLDTTAMGHVAGMLCRWPARRTLVFSGFWVPLLERLSVEGSLDPDTVILTHVDTTSSPSWTQAPTERFRHVWLHELVRGCFTNRVPTPMLSRLRYSERAPRFLLHGGGWSLGNYATAAEALARKGAECVLVSPGPQTETATSNGGMLWIDPSWEPWRENREMPRFPPMCSNSPSLNDAGTGAHHKLLELAATSRAIVSKPGGATLVDSLASLTPVLFLEPYGEHEARNLARWEQLGLGLSLDRWLRLGSPFDKLVECHGALAEACASEEHFQC